MKSYFFVDPPELEVNHENTKIGKHEMVTLEFFRVFVLSCFRDFFTALTTANSSFEVKI